MATLSHHPSITRSLAHLKADSTTVKTRFGAVTEMLSGSVLLILAPMSADGSSEELHRHAARRLLKARARRCEIYVQGERDGQATILEINKHVLAEERENARALSYGDAWG